MINLPPGLLFSSVGQFDELYVPVYFSVRREMLTSLKNPLVKQIRKLHHSSYRRKHQLFLLEGTNLIEAACSLPSELLTVCFTPQWQACHGQLWEIVTQKAQRVEVVTPEILGAMATTVNPDGIVATARHEGLNLPIPTSLQLGLVLEKLQDPGNLGTIIRSAVATGVDALWLSEESVDLEHPKVLRASVGEWFRLPMKVSPNLKVLVQKYQSQGVQIIATLPQASQTYWEIDFSRPSLILLGNEGAGLSDDLVSLADQQVRIPLLQNVESLNVAIAAALLLYEAQRQRF